MTTYKHFIFNGDEYEIHTNVGAAPRIFKNGVLDPTLKLKDFHWVFDDEYNSEWESVRIWRPHHINGKWRWPGEKVFRKRHMSPGGSFYEYGDEFSVLKDNI